MTDQITRERALDLLRQAVNEDGYGPEYVYPRPDDCQYVYDGEPACIVGHALHLGGWSIDDLINLDNQVVWANGEPQISGVLYDAAKVLGAAQAVQDMSGSWGEALRAAEAAAR